MEEPIATPPPAPTRGATLFVGVAITLAALALHFDAFRFPLLIYDDFVILSHSWTAQATGDSLWVPHNEHAMPLGRLLAWATIRISPSAAALPLLCAAQGAAALVLALTAIYVMVRTATQSRPLALLAN